MDEPVKAETLVEDKRVLELVNRARATYDARDLTSLLPGQLHSASFCPLGRSLRAGVEDWLFAAVGTKYLRVWAVQKDPLATAQGILEAWEVPRRLLKKSGEKSGSVLLPLPSELREFVNQFDRGLLPDYQGYVDPQEVLRLRELARGMPIPGKHPYSRLPGVNISTNVSMNVNP